MNVGILSDMKTKNDLWAFKNAQRRTLSQVLSALANEDIGLHHTDTIGVCDEAQKIWRGIAPRTKITIHPIESERKFNWRAFLPHHFERNEKQEHAAIKQMVREVDLLVMVSLHRWGQKFKEGTGKFAISQAMEKGIDIILIDRDGQSYKINDGTKQFYLPFTQGKRRKLRW
jgi:hypothetical protein